MGGEGRRMAAVLAAGPGAVLSHASAAALWAIWPTSATRIDVTVRSAGGRRKRPGLRIHRATKLHDDEITEHQAIRVTTPARTLLDLASSLPRRALERALDEAQISELVVETDGYRYHRTRRAFERDAILARAGYRTLRFTHRQLTRAPADVAATIRSSA